MPWFKTDSKIIILTAFGYDDYVQDAMKAGAVGFLLKDITTDELVASIIRLEKIRIQLITNRSVLSSDRRLQYKPLLMRSPR